MGFIFGSNHMKQNELKKRTGEWQTTTTKMKRKKRKRTFQINVE